MTAALIFLALAREGVLNVIVYGSVSLFVQNRARWQQ
jgi:hypothetical protein